MSGSREDLKGLPGLPDIYLSPSRSQESSKFGSLGVSDNERSVWDDTDSEVWTALVPEVTALEGIQLESGSEDEDSPDLALGQREEIEGDSSIDSATNNTNFSDSKSQAVSCAPREPEGSRESLADGISEPQEQTTQLVSSGSNNGPQWKHQRGETPGSDCPPVPGIGAVSRIFRQPLELSTNTQLSKSELVFSPGGDEGFIVPGGVRAYYGTGSGSETDDIEWQLGAEGSSSVVIPVRDAVEGADNAASGLPTYLKNRTVTPAGPAGMERNSPAGLSTPDAEIYLGFRTTSVNSSKPKSSRRPPVVGQSEEMQVQTSRKDLGSTDGEESDDDDQKRVGFVRDTEQSPSDIQQNSLGSQSENTDSVNTVLDMSRGEVQGCETDETVDTPVLSPSHIEPNFTHFGPKPTFVVGGPIAPRGKFKQFQNTVRGRMQDVMASLELEPNVDSKMYVDREQFLSQPPLCPPPVLVSEQEVSLASMISVESTNHPESSDRVTSPSVLSVSSAASSKRLEWDSGADVGYAGNTPEQITSSLSTLERIALGSYASVLRTEPEGTTFVPEKQKLPKKIIKSTSTKLVGKPGPSKRSYLDEASASSLKFLRGFPPREKCRLSSSEEDFENRFSSPGNSPRRRPRRKPASSNIKRQDLPIKSVIRTKKAFGRLKEVMKELNNEGKASSLVELNRTSRPIPECRSSSQQSLSYPPDSYSRSKVSSNVSVAACSSTSVATTVCQSTKPDENSAAGFSERELEGKGGAAEIENTSSRKPLPQQLRVRSGDQLSVSSSNEISSKSRGSSEAESVSDIRDTEGDSCPSSNLVSDEEPVNLKARKNSENARNHENITKQQLRLSKGRHVQRHWQRNNDDSSSSSSLQRSSGLDFSGSVLESQVSLQSCNNALQALSVKLRERIQALLDSGTMNKVQDYNKLQDYVAFIGTPSVNEEECRLKQGVANVIMRMFGEIGADDTDASNTLNSESSEPVTPTSLTHDSKAQGVTESIIERTENTDQIPQSEVPVGDTGSKPAPPSSESVVSPREEIARSVAPGGPIKLIPYRPPSATRTYFMAVSCDVEEGLVGAERGDSPTDDHTLAEAMTAREDDLRGQAEGQREARDNDSEIPSASAYSVETSEDVTHLDDPLTCERSGGNPPQSSSAKDWEDDESDSLSAAAALPHEWNSDVRSQLRAIGLPGAVTSDDSSPRRVGQYSTWDRRSSWHEDDKESRFAEATNWKFATTKSESLYKDKLGTLHIAKQPPGYTDDRDSHQSESTSDHEPHCPRSHDAESQEDRRPYVHPWTSSGSESAYETIRERHRHVDEALASSFEFYSTSPRDARLLGYVSSDAEKGQEKEEDNTANLDEPLDTKQIPISSPLHALPSPSDESSNKRQVKNRKKSLNRQEQHESHSSLEGATFISNLSSHTDGNDLSSSQVSFIKVQKHRYVRRIQRYIDSLEKLERALVGQLGDSVGSESSLRRYVTEGRSHTESDSNNKTQTRDILGQSETASSSTVSSDLSVDISHRKSLPPRWRKKGALTRNESHPVSQDSPHFTIRKLDDGSSHAAPPPLMHSSLASSPRISVSHRSSDVASSRTSTLKQIEKEVRMLALAEKKSRHAMQNNVKLQSQSTRGTRRSQYKNIQKIHREEPRGEEDPTRSLVVSRRGTLDSNLSANFSVPDQFLSQKGSTSSKKLQRTAGTDSDSVEEVTAQDIAENQISRQGDGRETRDTKLAGKGPLALFSSTYSQSNMSGPVQKGEESLSKSSSRQAVQRDFGQMFPSMLCLHPDADCSTHSIGVQTSVSLLCADGREIIDTSVTSRSSTRYNSGNDMHQNIGASIELHFEQNSTKPNNVRQDNSNSGGDQIPNALDKRNAYIASKDQRNIEAVADPSEKCNETNAMVSKQQSIMSAYSSQPDEKYERNIEGPFQDCQPTVCIQGAQKEDTQKSVHGESHTSNSSSAEQQRHVKASDFTMMQAPRSCSTGSEEQLAVPVDKRTSKLNSGRSEKDAELNQLLKLSITQSEMMETSSRDYASSPFCQQNEKSHGDSGVTENGHTKTGPSLSESSTSIVNDQTRFSHSNIKMNTDSTRTGDFRSIQGHRQMSKHSTNERGGKSLSKDNTKDSLPSNTNVLNLQAQEISSGQMDLENESVLQTFRSSHENDHNETDLLSGVPTSSRAEIKIMRDAKNRVLHMYSSQLMPYKQYAENDSDGLRTPEESRRNIQHKQHDFVQKQKKPVSFEVTVKEKENVQKNQPKSNIVYTPQGRSGVLVDLTRKNLTLQEALSKARPNYIREASERRALIRLKQDMRQAAQSHNHEVISQLPTNLQTPSTLQRFLYKPDIAPLFSYRDIREQNRRLYQLLPEANVHVVKSHRTAQNHTNRLMAEMYSQRLRKKVLKGTVSHGHKDIVTPISVHRK